MEETDIETRVEALETLTDDISTRLESLATLAANINTRLTDHLNEDEYELSMSAEDIDETLEKVSRYKAVRYGRVRISITKGDGTISVNVSGALTGLASPIILLTPRSSTVFVGWSRSGTTLTISITAKQGTFSADGTYEVGWLAAEGA